jgi:hypothetical protein
MTLRVTQIESNEVMSMRLYIFKSETKSDLRAFTADVAGSKLPDQFRPWHAVGIVGPEKDPPHRLSRKAIERAIDTQGFQLWRMKATGKSDQSQAGEAE